MALLEIISTPRYGAQWELSFVGGRGLLAFERMNMRKAQLKALETMTKAGVLEAGSCCELYQEPEVVTL